MPREVFHVTEIRVFGTIKLLVSDYIQPSQYGSCLTSPTPIPSVNLDTYRHHRHRQTLRNFYFEFPAGTKDPIIPSRSFCSFYCSEWSPRKRELRCAYLLHAQSLPQSLITSREGSTQTVTNTHVFFGGVGVRQPPIQTNVQGLKAEGGIVSWPDVTLEGERVDRMQPGGTVAARA